MSILLLLSLVTGPRRSLSLKLSDTRVNEPQMRDRLRLRGPQRGSRLCRLKTSRVASLIKAPTLMLSSMIHELLIWRALAYRRFTPCVLQRSVVSAHESHGLEQPLYRNMQWFRGGLVFEAHRLLYHCSAKGVAFAGGSSRKRS